MWSLGRAAGTPSYGEPASKGEVGVDAIRTSIGARGREVEAALVRDAEGVRRLDRRDVAEAMLGSRVNGLPRIGAGLLDESPRAIDAAMACARREKSEWRLMAGSRSGTAQVATRSGSATWLRYHALITVAVVTRFLNLNVCNPISPAWRPSVFLGSPSPPELARRTPRKARAREGPTRPPL